MGDAQGVLAAVIRDHYLVSGDDQAGWECACGWEPRFGDAPGMDQYAAHVAGRQVSAMAMWLAELSR